MAVQYQHTQRGTVLLVVIAVTVVFVLAGAVAAGMRVSESLWPLLLIEISPAVALAPVAWYFSSMTVTVTEDELRWRFGLGEGWRIARADIAGVSVVPHLWIAGYGIRWYGPERWVYIISGRIAVEVRLKQGGWRRFGTDDPTGLLNALTTAPAA
jgi:hypothetical protein